MHANLLLSAHAQGLGTDLSKSMKYDLTNFTAWMQLWFFANHSYFKTISFPPDSCALTEHMKSSTIIVGWKEVELSKLISFTWQFG